MIVKVYFGRIFLQLKITQLVWSGGKRVIFLLIFLKKILPVALIPLASLGINSTFTKAPFPSNDRGEIRSIELSNKILGIFSSMSCVIKKFTPFPDKASVTSSMGVAEIVE